MNKKIDFKYQKEMISFFNTKFTVGTIIFVSCLLLIGILVFDLILTLEVLGVISIFYIYVAVKTINIVNEIKYFKKNGKKCEGLIKGIKIDDNMNYSDDDLDTYKDVLLVIEYTNPYTNCLARFVSEPVYGNPYCHLKNLKVVVYALEDGKAYATGFKKIKKLKDAIRYHDDRFKNKEKEDM